MLYFPCVNCVVAQLLLSRGLSLQWLLEASHTQLKEMFPEITPSVFKVHTYTECAMSSHYITGNKNIQMELLVAPSVPVSYRQCFLYSVTIITTM